MTLQEIALFRNINACPQYYCMLAYNIPWRGSAGPTSTFDVASKSSITSPRRCATRGFNSGQGYLQAHDMAST